MYFPRKWARWRIESCFGSWQVANLVEINLEKLQHIIRHLSVDVLDIGIGNALPEQS